MRGISNRLWMAAENFGFNARSICSFFLEQSGAMRLLKAVQMSWQLLPQEQNTRSGPQDQGRQRLKTRDPGIKKIGQL